jgi:hypothetical protein
MALAAAGDAETGRHRRCHGSVKTGFDKIAGFRHIRIRQPVVSSYRVSSRSKPPSDIGIQAQKQQTEKFSSFEKAHALEEFHGVSMGVSYSMCYVYVSENS